MATVNEVLTSALAIMNETDTDSSYADRAVHIVNTLIGQCWQLSEHYESGVLRSAWQPVESLSDEIEGIDKTIALGVMPYGLAAILYLDEDAGRSNSWWQLYIEGIENAKRVPRDIEEITDVYECVPTSFDFGRW